MNIKLLMTVDRLKEVFELSKISIPSEPEFTTILNKINFLIEECSDFTELDLSEIPSFDWHDDTFLERRADAKHQWSGRDLFLKKAPVANGDYFRVPKIISAEENDSNGEKE